MIVLFSCEPVTRDSANLVIAAFAPESQDPDKDISLH